MMNQLPSDPILSYGSLPVRQKRRPWLLYLFLIVIFFITQHDLYYSLQDRYSPAAEEYADKVYEGSPLRRISFILLGVYGVISLTRKWGSPLRINGVQGWIIIGYLFWCIASLAWSINMEITLRRLVLFAMLCLGSLAAARRFSYRDFLIFVFLVGALYMVIGLIAEFALGTFRPWMSWYRFSGTVHPNTQAINGAMVYLSSVTLYRTASRRGRYVFVMTAVAAVLLMLLTKSRTGTAGAILAPIGFWALNLRKTHKFIIFSVLMVVITSTALLRDVAVPALQQSIQLQRDDVNEESDATLTGRIPLWIDAFTYINRRPVTGYGYGAFWTPEHILEIAALHSWAPNQGHSSYIDRLLDLGYTGMLAFSLVFLLSLRRAYLLRYRNGIVEYGFLGTILVFCLLDSMLESIILHPNVISFVSMVALAHIGFQNPEELDMRSIDEWR